ncbi:hypothetical protein T440DRAFT_433231 [Plenodomus tracheiphilus IPT5]|uniref:Uncharacterized protein n=1 Tax=Plenodomus tracheiphilus IPT5 TaxID=1408161 RepID=A0A6A7ASE9_9PLEO|nr:hypothetical protein T440DRAFT_433231 [Plenodomus tracheiphilus IPT5]
MNNLTGTQYEQRDIGISFLDILDLSLDSIWPVHEYGHALTLSESSWNDDENTWDWWETVATYISDEFHSTSTCRAAKASHGLSTEPWPSQINPTFLHENTHLILVDGNRTTGNRRAAFPFISYLNNNPDKYTGLGKQTLLNMLRKYKVGSNDTPFHVLATILAGTGTTVQKAVGRYWAHMAYFDIGHPSAHAVFLSERPNIVYDSLHANGTVKSEKAPRYMGANIIPLKIKGSNITVALQTSGQYTATLVVKSGEKLRYVDVVNGKGRVAVAKSDEVSLVVAYTPELIMYNSAAITAEMYANALQYSVKFTGASVA